MVQFEQKFDYIKITLASPARIKEWSQRLLPNGQIIGEVTKAETINYRTFKPEMDGLFCERIFGPNKNLECHCGKYKRVRYEGLICDRCGVEVTESRVRRYRMGYINLIYPVTHIWYMKSRPNYMALLLEVEQPELWVPTLQWGVCRIGEKYSQKEITEKRDYRIKRIKLAIFAYFIADNQQTFYNRHWDLYSYRKARRANLTTYSDISLPDSKEITEIGAAAIQKELQQLNVEEEIKKTRQFMTDIIFAMSMEEKIFQDPSRTNIADINCNTEFEVSQFYSDDKTHIINLDKIRETVTTKRESKRKRWVFKRKVYLLDKAIKRLRTLESFSATGAHPSWLILSHLPVIPPGLRPMIQLEGGRFATSDLNELYRRIITRNSRLIRLLEIDAPQLIIRNEKRMLQEAVDSLIYNGKRGKTAMGANNRPLKSLSDIIKGKQGRFRLNLLGKRVDYSGRSVIVVGPGLKLNQCGLPFEIAIELFQPFIIRELINQGLASNIKVAKNFIQQNETLIEPVLNEVLLNHPVFLNRAPTLHRLGIQSFEPILVPGRAIHLHPLVCSAFNADFDGDQMAVHVPLSLQAQAESYILMLAPYNFLSPATGEPIILPSQDMVLGCYYLTANNIPNLLGANHYFANFEDVLLAYNQERLELHSSIWVRYNKDIKIPSEIKKKIKLKDGTSIEYYEQLQIRKNENDKIIVQYLQTTTGRVIFNYTIQKILNIL
ncbi:DNA-directed RNA polymerase subunit beta' [Gloeomargaritaceae cyanobacterium AH-226-B11]|mgnify:CR=1 FL=1|jgi:DNA-directed RNA polymerase subunit beta'|nr:DNA-directed RNA polymerase subunit beta' [Gloeomargaritaceae cyanobacterium AH-226-B11]